MKTVEHITADLNRPNIFYAAYKVNRSCDCLKWVVDLLNKDPMAMPRVIIYCRTIDNISNVYKYFKESCDESVLFPGKKTFTKCRVIQFHQSIADRLKKTITTDFPNPKGLYRVVIASVSFGLGIDSPLVKYVIHFGAPTSIAAFSQESGRAGRCSTLTATSYLYYQLSNTNSIATDDEMTEYCLNPEGICYRQLVLNHFQPGVIVRQTGDHSCCLICLTNCMCGNCPTLPGVYTGNSDVSPNTESTMDYNSYMNISENDRLLIQDGLKELYNDLRLEYTNVVFSPFFQSGFTLKTISNISKQIEFISSIDDVYNIHVFEPSTARKVFDVIYNIVGSRLNEN